MSKDRVINNLDLKSCDKIIEFAMSNECDINTSEGSLLDNYIIYNTDKIRIGRAKPRKYIIIVEKFLNGWSSTLQLIQTDNYNKVLKYESILNMN